MAEALKAQASGARLVLIAPMIAAREAALMKTQRHGGDMQ